MKILGIIPARGGSKGVPGKNIKMLAGKPLIAWTIQEAKKSSLLTRIIISTDDEDIARVAREYGAEVPFLRPKEISQDLSTDVDFLDHAVKTLEESEGYIPDIIIRLPPTSPLRTANDIDTAIQKLLDTPEADSVRPIIEAPKHPFKFWKIQENAEFLEPFLSKEITGFNEPHNLPRQVLPKVYMHTGAMDVLWLKTLTDQCSTSGHNVAYFFMPPERSVNIDSLLDFEVAELLMQKRESL